MSPEERKAQIKSIKENPKLITVFWVLFSISVLLLVFMFRFYFWPALFALLVFIILNPIFLRLNEQFPGKKNLSAFILILGAVVLIILPIVFLLIALSQEAVRASDLIQTNIKFENVKALILKQDDILSFFKDFGISPDDVIKKLVTLFQKGTDFFIERLSGLISGSLNFSFELILMVIILFFLLKEGDRITRGFYELLPFPDELERQILNRTARVIRYVFYGNIFIMISQGLGIFILFLFFQVPSALLWSVVAGIFSVIPIISTTVVWIPAVIFLSITENYVNAIFLGTLALIIAQVLENIVKPLILDKRLNIHPLVLFFALFGGLQAFGLVGLILGPVLITIFMTLFEVYRVIEEFSHNGDGRHLHSDTGVKKPNKNTKDAQHNKKEQKRGSNNS